MGGGSDGQRPFVKKSKFWQIGCFSSLHSSAIFQKVCRGKLSEKSCSKCSFRHKFTTYYTQVNFWYCPISRWPFFSFTSSRRVVEKSCQRKDVPIVLLNSFLPLIIHQCIVWTSRKLLQKTANATAICQEKSRFRPLPVGSPKMFTVFTYFLSFLMHILLPNNRVQKL